MCFSQGIQPIDNRTYSGNTIQCWDIHSRLLYFVSFTLFRFSLNGSSFVFSFFVNLPRSDDTGENVPSVIGNKSPADHASYRIKDQYNRKNYFNIRGYELKSAFNKKCGRKWADSKEKQSCSWDNGLLEMFSNDVFCNK